MPPIHGSSLRSVARYLLYALSHIQDSTHRCLCYTSRGARSCSMDPTTLRAMSGRSTTKLHLFPTVYRGGRVRLSISLIPPLSISAFFLFSIPTSAHRGCSVCNPVRGMGHIRYPKLLIGKK